MASGAAEREVVVGGVDGEAVVVPMGWKGCGDGLCALATAPLYEMGLSDGEVEPATAGEGAARPIDALGVRRGD